jgi:hypothetical protein
VLLHRRWRCGITWLEFLVEFVRYPRKEAAVTFLAARAASVRAWVIWPNSSVSGLSQQRATRRARPWRRGSLQPDTTSGLSPRPRRLRARCWVSLPLLRGRGTGRGARHRYREHCLVALRAPPPRSRTAGQNQRAAFQTAVPSQHSRVPAHTGASSMHPARWPDGTSVEASW